jgi:hypothetical protein
MNQYPGQYGQPSFGSTSQYGQPSFGSTSQYGQPSFGSTSQYGHPSLGSTTFPKPGKTIEQRVEALEAAQKPWWERLRAGKQTKRKRKNRKSRRS